MPQPTVYRFVPSSISQPLSYIVQAPTLLFDATRKGAGTVPPMLWEPPSKSIAYSATYGGTAFSNVFCHIARCAFFNPLKITSFGTISHYLPETNTQGFFPEVIMVFDCDSVLPIATYPIENAVEMEYWQTGTLITLELDFTDGYDFTAQALILERAGEVETIDFHDLAPIFMEGAHLLNWKIGDGDSGKYGSVPAPLVFDEMRRVANHPLSVASQTCTALPNSDPGTAGADTFDDTPF